MLRAQFLPFVAGNLVSHSLGVLIDLFTLVFARILNFSKNRKVIFSHVYGAKKRKLNCAESANTFCAKQRFPALFKLSADANEMGSFQSSCSASV